VSGLKSFMTCEVKIADGGFEGQSRHDRLQLFFEADDKAVTGT
jgi:hypothetical protein